MTKRNENIALFDMDRTLCDYETKLVQDLNDLRSPEEDIIKKSPRDNDPEYLRRRSNIIRSSIEWWSNSPVFSTGMDVWEVAKELGYRRMILTQGPKMNPNAWAGKKLWLDKEFSTDIEATITHDKGLVYGKVLVDDCPEYIERWLEWRPRGLVIMLASKDNRFFYNPQVIRYNGYNLKEVSNAMEKHLKKDDD